jgi:hypothetical protein
MEIVKSVATELPQPSILESIQKLIDTLDQISATYWADCKFTHAKPPTHAAQFLSQKWVRIVRIKNPNQGESSVDGVHCFVCLSTFATKTLGPCFVGGIYRAASFKTPAKHARGNVFDADFAKCLSVYGANYLK